MLIKSQPLMKEDSMLFQKKCFHFFPPNLGVASIGTGPSGNPSDKDSTIKAPALSNSITLTLMNQCAKYAT